MKIFQWVIFCVLSLESSMGYSHDALRDHNQLIVVTSEDWNAIQASLQRYERQSENESWVLIGEQISVVLGKAGLAWGIGLQPFPIDRAHRHSPGWSASVSKHVGLGNNAPLPDPWKGGIKKECG